MNWIKQRGKKILVIAAVLSVIVAVVYAAEYFYEQNVRFRQFEQLRETAVIKQPEAEPSDEGNTVENTETSETKCQYDFEMLRETNKDIYAWITIPGTQVDYPVLQAEEDDYYLDHNLDHTQGYPGCIYTNHCNAADFTDILTVLYGHNMKNGSMFGWLHEFEKEDFFREHQEIVISTEERQMTYEIVAATVFADLYIPAFYGVDSEKGKDEFLEEIRRSVTLHSGSWFREDRKKAGQDERYIVLSTCIDGKDDQRYLLVGRMVQTQPE